MTAGVLQAASPPSEHGAARRVRDATMRVVSSSFAMALGCGVLATAIVLVTLAQPGALHGVTQYDDGVYYGAAAQLSRGVLPYRDFTLVQPPGIAVLLAPIAFLTHGAGSGVGLGVARVLTALVTGLDAFLAAFVLRHRGRTASAIGGLGLAIYPAGFFADRTVLLEPYLVACLLGATALAFSEGRLSGPGRLALAGACFGVGGAIKAWAVLPFVCLALLALGRHGERGGLRRAVLPLIAGCAVGFGALCGPFFALAPARFVHDVIVTQLSRSAPQHLVANRLDVLTGLHGIAGISPQGIAVPLLVAAAFLAVAGWASIWPALQDRSAVEERYFLLATATAVAAVLAAPDFYDHYGAFPAAFAALVAGCVAGRARRALARFATPRRRLARRLPLAAAACVVILVAALVVGEIDFDVAATKGAGNPALAIDTAIPPGACAISDAPILLVSANRYLANRPGCPAVVDPEGTLLALSAGRPRPASPAKVPGLAAIWHRWLARSEFFVESGTDVRRVPWTPGLATWFAHRFIRLPDPGASVYVRRTYPGLAPLLSPRHWRRVVAARRAAALNRR